MGRIIAFTIDIPATFSASFCYLWGREMQRRDELPRVGETVETVCLLMSLLSLAGGVVCAVQFGKVMHMGYAGSIRAEVSPVLVAA